MYERGRDLLGRPIHEDEDWESDKLAKYLYASCMDLEGIRERIGLKTAKNLIVSALSSHGTNKSW